jgi:transglutaminase-like putative cysteine protease
MLYHTIHTTRYTYEGPVSYCLSEARLKPRQMPRQSLREFSLSISPDPLRRETRTDYFGNEVCSFAVFDTHDQLTVTSSSIVQVLPESDSFSWSIGWRTAADQMGKSTETAVREAAEYCCESPFVPWVDEVSAMAKPIFGAERPLVEVTRELMETIYKQFRYAPKSTTIETPLAEVWRHKRGVCQDFAHIMIGALRGMGLAARYVSGYLRSGEGIQGAQASHAWVSLFVPGSGWIDFDPTNNVIPSTGHLTLAWGRDFGDVTPVKGITLGGGAHAVEVDVRVQSL